MTNNSELRVILKYITFMKITEQIATLSYDNKYQVGSILVKKDFSNISAIGYNGNFPGGGNKRDSNDSGKSGFLHAEENVLIKSNILDPENYILMVTMTPCNMCAKRIASKGIKEVISLHKYDNVGNTFDVFKKANIKFHYLEDKISVIFLKTALFKEFLKGIDKWYLNDLETINFYMNNILISQIDKFLNINKEPIKNIPIGPLLIDLNDNYFNNPVLLKEKIIKEYLRIFTKTLYDIL